MGSWRDILRAMAGLVSGFEKGGQLVGGEGWKCGGLHHADQDLST